MSMAAGPVVWVGFALVSSVHSARARCSQHREAPDRPVELGRKADAAVPVVVEADVLVPLAEPFVDMPFPLALEGSALLAFRDMADGSREQ